MIRTRTLVVVPQGRASEVFGQVCPRCAPRHSTAGRIGVHHRTGSDLAQDDRRQLDAEVEDARGFASD